MTHPKTYNILLHRPFGALTGQPYVFYLHAHSAQDALHWVARVFEGIDIEPTKRRWAEPASTHPRVGNSDPVVVHDCDQFTSRERIGGKTVVRDLPAGYFRRSSKEVAADLLKIFHALQDERTRLTQAFEHMKACYEREGVSWYYGRLLKMKAAIERATHWQGRVWAEYWATQADPALVMPLRESLAA